MMDAYSHLDMTIHDPLFDLKSRMVLAEIDRALIVETWSGENRACLKKAIKSSFPQFRVALCFRPTENLPPMRLIKNETVVALRVKTADLVLFQQLGSFMESSGKWLLAHAERGIAALSRELIPLVRQFPRLRIYVPHLAWPKKDGIGENDWADALVALRRLPHIVVGISAIAHFSCQPFPHHDIKPFAYRLLEVFDANSVVVGSDYPLFEKDRYADYMALALNWIDGVCAQWSPEFETMCFSDRNN